MKLRKQNNTVLNAAGKFSQTRDNTSLPSSLTQSVLERLDSTQLGKFVIQLLSDKHLKNLEVSQVQPFFWSLVETYVDLFQLYPVDASKALLSHLESYEYPEEIIKQMAEQLELQFKKSHGRPLRKSPQRLVQPVELHDADDEIEVLRDTLKYAAMVAENSEEK